MHAINLDGKTIPFDRLGKVDILSVVVSSNGVDEVLSFSKIPSGTGMNAIIFDMKPSNVGG